MRAGRLNRRVTVQRAVETANTFGEIVKNWVQVAQVWASVEPMKGGERFRALQVQADVDTNITMRWQPDLAGLAPNDRVVHESRIYDIRAVINPGERNKELQLMCKVHL